MDMGVNFKEVDTDAFKARVSGVQEELMAGNEKLRPIFDRIQEINAQTGGGQIG